MKYLDFLVCYDIADEKRLKKIAKYMEKNSTRIQNSVFLYPKVTKERLLNLVEKLQKLINHDEDDVRIYLVDIKHSLRLKSGLDLTQPFCIVEDFNV